MNSNKIHMIIHDCINAFFFHKHSCKFKFTLLRHFCIYYFIKYKIKTLSQSILQIGIKKDHLFGSLPTPFLPPQLLAFAVQQSYCPSYSALQIHTRMRQSSILCQTHINPQSGLPPHMGCIQ